MRKGKHCGIYAYTFSKGASMAMVLHVGVYTFCIIKMSTNTKALYIFIHIFVTTWLMDSFHYYNHTIFISYDRIAPLSFSIVDIIRH